MDETVNIDIWTYLFLQMMSAELDGCSFGGSLAFFFVGCVAGTTGLAGGFELSASGMRGLDASPLSPLVSSDFGAFFGFFLVMFATICTRESDSK